jgi:hypothetical protein
VFEERFTATRMARDYVDVFDDVLTARNGPSIEVRSA